MSTPQEYWDACVIRTWRQHGATIEAMAMFKSITGKRADELDLLRTPTGLPYYPPALRAFVADRLPKISEWLHKCGPEHDKALLKKLSASTYTISHGLVRPRDAEKAKLRAQLHKDKMVAEFETRRYSHRNHHTDWGTTK